MRKYLLLLLVGCTMAYGQANKETLFLISNTHLDTQWNWDVKTTINEYIKNTLTQNMALMDKYPNFMLNYEGAVKYMWMKEYYPTEFEKMKGYIARGQWHVSGMSLDATDVMMSSAESFPESYPVDFPSSPTPAIVPPVARTTTFFFAWVASVALAASFACSA